MRGPDVSIGFKLMFSSPKYWSLFILGSAALSVLGNACYGLLTSWLGSGMSTLGYIAAAMLIVILGTAWFINRLSKRLKPTQPDIGIKKPDKYRGLILLVSNEATSWKAVKWHGDTLERCWLLCTERSLPVADGLKERLTERGKVVDISLIKNANDLYEPLKIRDRVNRIYTNLPDGLSEFDVITDFTGMTSCASVGAVLACLNGKRPIQYVPAQFGSDLQRPLEALEPIEVTLTWDSATPPKQEVNPSVAVSGAGQNLSPPKAEAAVSVSGGSVPARKL